MNNWTKIHQEIVKAESILLTTHENPDGDGIGSIVALAYHLTNQNKNFRIILTSELPDAFKFLDPNKKFEVYDEELHTDWVKNVDLSILLDIGNYTRVGKMWEKIKQNGTVIVNIDHHPIYKEQPYNINENDVNASATGELIYKYLNEVDPASLSEQTYAAIYVAIMTDTGSFSYKNTNILCHEIAANAIEAGVDTAKVHQNVYGSSSKARIKLLAAIADNLQYEYDGKLVWFKITQAMMKKAQASNDDVDGFTDFARAIKGVEVSLMIFEKSDNTCRISFRSKGRFAINKIAQFFDGGGHAFAAGAVVSGKIADVVPKVVSKTIEILSAQDKDLE